jgi:hypothetical protein
MYMLLVVQVNAIVPCSGWQSSLFQPSWEIVMSCLFSLAFNNLEKECLMEEFLGIYEGKVPFKMLAVCCF